VDWFKRKVLSVDPRTLGLFRIALAILLLGDLLHRAMDAGLWYANDGLLPNHTGLWRPLRAWVPSVFWGCSTIEESRVLMVGVAAAYLGLLVGYRTRLFQVLALVSILSLQIRVDILSNGGDFVLCILCVWTVFLPLGRRFSVDALLADLRSCRERSFAQLEATQSRTPDSAPIVSLAVMAASVQFASIYFFNTIHKHGETWRDGSAVYYMWQQTRQATAFAVWARDLPLAVAKGLSWSTLAMEAALSLLILTPVFRAVARPLAIVLVVALHVGIASFANLGVFSYVMMVYSLILLPKENWDWAERKLRRHCRTWQVVVDPDNAVAHQLLRVFVRLDWLGRLRLVSSVSDDDSAATVPEQLRGRALVVGGDDGKSWVAGAAALVRLVSVAPLLLPVAWGMRLPPFWQLCERFCAHMDSDPQGQSRFWGISPLVQEDAGAAATADDAASSELPGHRLIARRVSHVLREAVVVFLIYASTLQMLMENRAIPKEFKPEPGRWHLAVISITRLQQGWQMFAPDVPRNDVYLAVDAVTTDGRHVDPLAEAAGVARDATSREMPLRPGLSVYFVSYMQRLPGDKRHHRPLTEWIQKYHERTGREQDKVVSFEVDTLQVDSPAPGQPANPTRKFRVTSWRAPGAPRPKS